MQSIIRETKPGWVQGPCPAQMGGPAPSALRAGGPGCRGASASPALQPAASWGFHKYLPNKETTAFAFPVIVAPAPPPVGAGGGGPRPCAAPPALPRPGQRWSGQIPSPRGGSPWGAPTQWGSAKRDPGPSLPTASETWVACPDTGRQLLLGALGQPPSSKRLLPAPPHRRPGDAGGLWEARRANSPGGYRSCQVCIVGLPAPTPAQHAASVT